MSETNKTTRETRTEMQSASRPKRVPLHEQRRDRLAIVDGDPNQHYRVVTDRDDRIEKFKLGGYKVSEKRMKLGQDQESGNIAVGSGTQVSVGNGDRGVLMEIPKEQWEEDQKAKMKDIAEKERLMRRRKGELRGDGLEGEVEIKN